MQILGISVDPVDSHKKFCDSLKLPFPLLADDGGKVSKLYGILITTQKGDLLSGRSVFLVDKEGVLRYADLKYELKPADHEELLKALQDLKGNDGERKSGTEGSKKADAKASPPKIEGLKFGQITVDGKEYTADLVLDGGKVRERDKRPSRGEREKYGHTPLTPREEIPWDCKILILGTGMDGSLPVTDELKDEAKRRGVKLFLLKTPEAVEYLLKNYAGSVNAILHITC